jgi:hypothetical protein
VGDESTADENKGPDEGCDDMAASAIVPEKQSFQ